MLGSMASGIRPDERHHWWGNFNNCFMLLEKRSHGGHKRVNVELVSG